jgi:hypothetical protein
MSIQDILGLDTGVDRDARHLSQLCCMFFLKNIDGRISSWR